MNTSWLKCLPLIVLAANPLLAAYPSNDGPANADWKVYRGDPGGTQFVELAQIHAANVHRLKPVWTYHTGDKTARSTMHVNPIVIDGIMYITTPAMKAVALDARTGMEIWSFDPAPFNNGEVVRLRNRGVAYWKGAVGDAEGERIFHFVRERVYALDAKTGKLIPSFGKGGFINLKEHLDKDPASIFIEMTSPGAVYKNLLILGSRVNESYDASPGHVRAYDTVTGELKWTFHTIPKEGQFGHDTWTWVKGENYGGANAWGGVTIDEKRGLAFVATGSAAEDFYGGFRKGSNLFANTVLALDAHTGRRKWHYQTVHHDIWDYDNPPAPVLVTINKDGRPRDVVVQLTKMGFTFVLDRGTGEPLFPVVEVPVSKSTVPGEEAYPTQPFPSKPPPLNRQGMTEADLSNITPETRQYVLKEFRKYVSGPLYTPITLQGTITMPGHLGGVEWSGASYDPSIDVLCVNVNELPTINKLRPINTSRTGGTPQQLGRQIYERSCIACHGAERRAVPPGTPALLNIQKTDDEIKAVILQGRNNMPATPLRANEVNALVAYLRADPADVPPLPAVEQPDRYTMSGYPWFVDQDGHPGISPPWGTLNAIDLAKGEILWKVPLGEYPDLVAKGIRNTGTPNFGGPVATAGGIIFIAATADEKIRAFEKHSGRVLWEYQLPAGGYATPTVHMLDGKQYVTIAAGGSGKNATPSGDAIVTFALASGDEGNPPLKPGPDGWITLFDGQSLDGWVHMNGSQTYTVEEGAIVGRTAQGSENSFLCTTSEYADFELELETMIDKVTNSGIQIRTQVRPVTYTKGGQHYDLRGYNARAGRINGPQVEIRRSYDGQPSTGVLYGEGMATGWLSSREKITNPHQFFYPEAWNHLRIVAKGPRIQTWANGHPIEDLKLDEVYQTHKKGFIALQIHALNGREPGFKEAGLTVQQPLIMKWRNIRIRPLQP